MILLGKKKLRTRDINLKEGFTTSEKPIIIVYSRSKIQGYNYI